MFILSLFLFIVSHEAVADSKYDQAIKTAMNAAAKQSGLEADYFKARSIANKKVALWARKNGIETPLAVVSFAAPIIYRKQVRIKSGDFLFKANNSKVTLDWQFQF